MDTATDAECKADEASGILTKVVASVKEVPAMAAELRRHLKQRAEAAGLETEGTEIWYRGHAKRSYKLIPSLLRFSHGPEVEKELLPEYKLKRPDADDWSTLFEMQHHFVPTRLLDWTVKLNVALYFAANADETDSPCVFLLHPCILNDQALKAGMPSKMVSSAKPCIIELKSPQFRYREDWLVECDRGHAKPLAIFPPSKLLGAAESSRLEVQGSRFTLHGAEFSPLEEQCPQAFAKIEMHGFNREQADDYFKTMGITHSDIFPDLTGISMYLKDRFKLKPDPEKRIAEALKDMWRHDNKLLLQGDKAVPEK